MYQLYYCDANWLTVEHCRGSESTLVNTRTGVHWVGSRWWSPLFTLQFTSHHGPWWCTGNITLFVVNTYTIILIYPVVCIQLPNLYFNSVHKDWRLCFVCRDMKERLKDQSIARHLEGLKSYETLSEGEQEGVRPCNSVAKSNKQKIKQMKTSANRKITSFKTHISEFCR